MPIKLSEIAETQINEIVYALGCTKSQAISHALESQHAFEKITEDQIFNWLEDNHKEALAKWQTENDSKLAKIEAN